LSMLPSWLIDLESTSTSTRTSTTGTVSIPDTTPGPPHYVNETFLGQAQESSIWDKVLSRWYWLPFIYVYTIDYKFGTTVKYAIQGIVGVLLASLNMSILNNVVPPTRGGACSEESVPACQPFWWPGHSAEFSFRGFFPFLIMVCDFSFILWAVLWYKRFQLNVKIFALTSHVYFMMSMLSGANRSELLGPPWFGLNAVIFVLCALGAVFAVIAVGLWHILYALHQMLSHNVASSQHQLADRHTAARAPLLDGTPSTFRVWSQAAQFAMRALLSAVFESQSQSPSQTSAEHLQRCIWKWVAISTCFWLSVAGLLTPEVDTFSTSLASTACLFMDARGDNTLVLGQQRFLGVALGSIIGFLALTVVHSYVRFLLLLAFALECWTLYRYVEYLMNPLSLARRLNVDWQIVAAYLAISMLPSNGFAAWSQQMVTSEGMAWALADQYRTLVANLIAVLVTFCFDTIRDKVHKRRSAQVGSAETLSAEAGQSEMRSSELAEPSAVNSKGSPEAVSAVAMQSMSRSTAEVSESSLTLSGH